MTSFPARSIVLIAVIVAGLAAVGAYLLLDRPDPVSPVDTASPVEDVVTGEAPQAPIAVQPNIPAPASPNLPQPTRPAAPATTTNTTGYGGAVRSGLAATDSVQIGPIPQDRMPAALEASASRGDLSSAAASSRRADAPSDTIVAEVLLRAPAAMALNQSLRVTATLSPNLIGEHVEITLATTAQGDSQWAGGTLLIDETFVTATLDGSDQFAIQPAMPQRLPSKQETRLDTPMTWAWTVNAVAGGRGVLTLRIESPYSGTDDAERAARSLTLAVTIPVQDGGVP